MLGSSCKCTGCERQFPVLYGIPCLAEHRSYGYSEIGEQRMHEFLEDCQQTAWQRALQRLVQMSSNPLELMEQAVGPWRAGWWPLLNLQPNWRVLDVGCGWGAITFGLARMVSLVVACDLNVELLRFLKARTLQDGVSNVQLLCAGDTPRLPFADREFDLVILNGVLAWVPLSKLESPVALQRAFLGEAARLLAPNGQLLLAVQNRWSSRHWKGEPEDRISLPFISLLPRVIADLYAKKVTGKLYRTHTHSFWTYKRLLRFAGFMSSKAFIPLPNFQSFDAIVDPAKKQTVERYFAEHGSARFETVRLKARSSLAPLLATSFFWIANREKSQASFLDLLGEHLAVALYGAGRRCIEWVKFRVSRRELVTCELKIKGVAPNMIVRLPLTPFAKIRANSEHETLKSLDRLLASTSQWPEIPKALLKGEFRNVPYFAQEALPGFSGARFLRSSPGASECKRLALNFIVRLHLATQIPVKLQEATWDESIMPLLDPGLRSTEQLAGINAAYIRDYLMQELTGYTWPFVLSHGDFWLGNLLFDMKARCLLGVIDWDRALPRSLPLIDLLHLLLSGRLDYQQRPTVLFGKVLLEGLNREDSGIVESYLQRMGFSLSFRQLRAFLLLDWLLRISTWVLSCPSPWSSQWVQHWLQENVKPSASWLEQLLGSSSAGPLQ